MGIQPLGRIPIIYYNIIPIIYYIINSDKIILSLQHQRVVGSAEYISALYMFVSQSL